MFTGSTIEIVHVADFEAFLILDIDVVGSELLMSKLLAMKIVEADSKLKENIQNSLAVYDFILVLEEARLDPVTEGLPIYFLDENA